jgi:hypothetical protein
MPKHHQGLGSVLSEGGDPQGAASHWQTGFGQRPLVALPYRGEGPSVPLLLLTACAGRNIPLLHLPDDQVYETFVVFVEYYDLARPLPPHRLIFNAIGDADLANRGSLQGSHYWL